MQQDYDFVVFIGRFQPFHAGHLQVVRTALASSRKVILLFGSSWQPRSLKNPWTHFEREAMVRACLTQADNNRLHCQGLMDTPNDNAAWVKQVNSVVGKFVEVHHITSDKPANIALIGHNKDESSFYLSLFPEWESIDVGNYQSISATPLRERFFTLDPAQYTDELVRSGVIPDPVGQWLLTFATGNEEYHLLK